MVIIIVKTQSHQQLLGLSLKSPVHERSARNPLRLHRSCVKPVMVSGVKEVASCFASCVADSSLGPGRSKSPERTGGLLGWYQSEGTCWRVILLIMLSRDSSPLGPASVRKTTVCANGDPHCFPVTGPKTNCQQEQVGFSINNALEKACSTW